MTTKHHDGRHVRQHRQELTRDVYAERLRIELQHRNGAEQRYAPPKARHGFQVPKTTSANAIQPRPALIPSTHMGVKAVDKYAPAMPLMAPPNSTAR